MTKINPHLTLNTFFIGEENTPVVVIDDLLLDCKAAMTEAYQAPYIKMENFYPGVRAHVGGDYGMTVLRYVADIIYREFNVPRHLTLIPTSGSYSLLTQQEHDMEPLQCIPHYDDSKAHGFAMLHYLNPGDFGGTGFYQHKPTGFENIYAERKDDYLNSLQDYVDTHGLPEQKYFTDSTEHYELVHKIDYKPNRLVIYPATILHSAYIDNPQHDVNPDPKTGRLSANFFMTFQPT